MRQKCCKGSNLKALFMADLSTGDTASTLTAVPAPIAAAFRAAPCSAMSATLGPPAGQQPVG